MKRIIFLKKVFCILLFSIFFLGFFYSRDAVSDDNNDVMLTINSNFNLLEFSNSNGSFININSIDIDLPSPTWKIENIELNFTDFKFDVETKIIEDNPIHFKYIEKTGNLRKYGLGVQIKITDPTIIYGVEIYGQNESIDNFPIFLQINGYDNSTNSPNNDVYGSYIRLNMALESAWYEHNFSTPINLQKGNYYLTIDGSSIGNDPNSKYRWYYNNENPIYPDLYSASYISGSWTNITKGAPFLYKLNQKVNATFYPQEINMTAQIDGSNYEVSNVEQKGKGYLKKSKLDYHPNENKLKIKVKNNKTGALSFNVTYIVDINNILKSIGSLNIYSNSENEWSIQPEIVRVSDNHTIKFIYPKGWFGIDVFKNGLNISSDLIIDKSNYFILFPNSIIENGANWEIKAFSLNKGLSIKADKMEFEIGKELQFSIQQPIKAGNYTFRLFNPLGFEKYNITKEIPPNTNIFSYTIPTTAIEGNYTAYIFWYNQTDAASKSQTFHIIPSTLPTPSSQDTPIFLIITIAIIGGSAIGVGSYMAYKKVGLNKRNNLKLILEKCSDIMNLEYIIVLDTKSGIDVFSLSLGKKEVDATLISGFLHALHNFGTEVLEGVKESRTIKVEYKKSIILMNEFVNLRLILIMKENPSKNFLYSIESLAYDIYTKYGKLIDHFQGNLQDFRGIKDLIEKHLSISFIYPLTIEVPKKAKLTQNEKDMVQKALKFMEENKFNYFYSLYLLPDNECSPKDYETILNLIEKGIFRPIEEE